jgi:aryl-alcohol dehydrogenase-like predicted oxidoreductase
MGLPRIVSIQNPYSLLNRSFEAGCAEIAIRENVGLLAYAPMAAGALSGKYLGGARPEGARMTRHPENTRYLKPVNAEAATGAYVELARSRGLDPGLMALAWVNMQHFLTSNIIGASTMQQLEHDLTSIDITLDEETLQELETIHARYTYPCP